MARWVAGGLLFLGLNIALLYAFVHGMGLRVAFATILSAEICTILRFFLNERWVFGTRRFSGRRLWQFHLSNGCAFVVWWAATNLLTGRGCNYLVASILAVGFSVGFSFASNFLWLGRRPHAVKPS
jgi:putative flippase GtrA